MFCVSLWCFGCRFCVYFSVFIMSSSCKFRFKGGRWYVEEGIGKDLVLLDSPTSDVELGSMDLVQFVDDSQSPDLRLHDCPGSVSYTTSPVMHGQKSVDGDEESFPLFEQTLERPYVSKHLRKKTVDYSKVPLSLAAYDPWFVDFFRIIFSLLMGVWETCCFSSASKKTVISLLA